MRSALSLLAVIACTAAVNIITPRDVVDKSAGEAEVTLSETDFASSSLVSEIDLNRIGIKVKDDPTLGNLQEGDIAMPSVKDFVDANNKLGRNAIRQPYRRWPNGEIPYTMSSQYGSYARSVIAKAMKEYHDKTCIRFVARDPSRHPDYVYIHPDDGCYSLVGKTGGRQPLSLDSGCIQVGTIVHELMHAVGFFHEQSRSDRDEFIDIEWRNVMNGADDQFEKYNLNVIEHLNEPYDYSSIMHYGPYAFSGSGKKTISAKRSGSERMGQRVAFSQIDLRKINKLYNCGASTGGAGTGNIVTGNSIEQSRQVRNPAPPPQQPLPPVTYAPTIYNNNNNNNNNNYGYVKPAHANANVYQIGSQYGQNNNNNNNYGYEVDSTGNSKCTGNTQTFEFTGLPTKVSLSSLKCRDDNWRCPFWAMFGNCESYEEIRNEACRLSCRNCDGHSVSATSTHERGGEVDNDILERMRRLREQSLQR